MNKIGICSLIFFFGKKQRGKSMIFSNE